MFLSCAMNVVVTSFKGSFDCSYLGVMSKWHLEKVFHREVCQIWDLNRMINIDLIAKGLQFVGHDR